MFPGCLDTYEIQTQSFFNTIILMPVFDLYFVNYSLKEEQLKYWKVFPSHVLTV